MTELPYDVWLHITGFLNREEMWRLLSVNRTLFAIAMDKHYETTYVGFARRRGPKEPQLHEPTIASRVRTLELRIGPPCRLPEESRPSKGRMELLKRRLNLALSWYHSRHKNPERIPTVQDDKFKSFMDAVHNLTSVSALVIQLSTIVDREFHPLKLAILDNRWTTFACSLRCLTLRTPLEDLVTIIPRDIKLVQLEKFDLKVSITYRSSDPDELMRKTILPFLTSHKHTLEILVLDAEEIFDISSFLKEIPRIPHLSSFCLHQSLTSSDRTRALSGHHHFLKAHQLHLLDLEMKFTPWYSLCPTTEVWFTQTWCHVHLPKLRSLSLSLPTPRYHDNVVGAIPCILLYIQPSQTLTTLSLSPTRFSYEEASILIPPLGAGVLRTLELFVWTMCPELLQLFAEHMPKLQSLKLDTKYYSPEKGTQVGVEERISRFCQAMTSVAFPDWELYDFQLEPFYNLHRDDLLLVMGAALPRVQFFCGIPRSGDGSFAMK